MKKFLLIISIISMAAISCANKDNAGGATESLVTKNIPSLLKNVKEGNKNTQKNIALSVSANVLEQANAAAENTTLEDNNNPEKGTYNLLERLYSTAWYQSEKEVDDGKLETEENFIFFNQGSEMVEREYENGILDGRDEYSALEWIADIKVTAGKINSLSGDYDRNACIVRNTEIDDDRDTKYEAYYLYDKDTLYVVDGDTYEELLAEFKKLINDINGDNYKANGDKYLLSVKAKK